MEKIAPVPGYKDYFITSDGKVFNNGKMRVPIDRPGDAMKVRLQKDGIRKDHGLAKMVANAFVPNPHNHKRIIFLDGDNKNCKAENIAWANEKEFSRYTLFPGKPLENEKGAPKTKKPNEAEKKTCQDRNIIPAKKRPDDPTCVPLPNFPNYYVSPMGDVYSMDKKLMPQRRGGESARLKVKDSEGRLVRHQVSWLVATVFIPNPNGYPKLVFLDWDRGNPKVGNLQWMSQEQHDDHYYHSSLLGTGKKKKSVPPSELDADAVPIVGYDGYSISSKGIVYKGNQILKPTAGKGKALRIRLRLPNAITRTYRNLGLATLVAEHFVPNPRKHSNIIFKDRDNRNCCSENIAWVDGETFMYYAGRLQNPGRPKIVLEREDARRRCSDPMLCSYYGSLDEDWLEMRWKEADKNLCHLYRWEQFRSECYMYFMERARRFSLLRKPEGLLVFYMKGLKAKLRKEISNDIPFGLLVRTDESLRDIDRYGRDDEW